MVNLAEPLLGGLYDTLNGAFGSQAAWLLGHLLLAAVGFSLIALARNWSEIVNGAELRRSHATDALLFCIVTGFQVQMYHETTIRWRGLCSRQSLSPERSHFH